ncbi:MAG: hypothetical protein KF767_17635 [Bdellovibrionaceae bacterium]|nr:hypothetical protein [Pseudobdellovibrionaceae bacterium]
MTTKDKNISKEFGEFLSSPEVIPPLALRDSILSTVQKDLNPSGTQVFLRVIGVHTVVSLFSLSICSQFGLQSFKIFDAMNWAMSYVGHAYCMAFCGLLYLGISALALSLLLKPEDVRVLRQHRFLQVTLLSGVSLGVFLCLGAQILLIPGALWITGAIIGGVSTLELGWLVRSKFRRQLVFGT